MSKQKTFLSIDIGTENLKVALCVENQSTINIIGYSNLKQTFQSMKSGFILDVSRVIANIDIATGNCIDMAKRNSQLDFALPSAMVFGIAGELVLGSTVVIEMERDHPETIITEKEFADFQKNIQSETFDAVAEELAEAVCMDRGVLEQISASISSIKLDGIDVQNPIGHKAHMILATIFIAFAPRIHLETIQKISKHFKIKNFKTVVEPYAIAQAIDISDGKSGSAVIVDIGGGTTDVAIVSRGEFVGARMYSLGGRVFTEALAKEKHINFEEAERLKIKYASDKISEKEKIEVSRIVNEVCKLWADGLLLTIQTIEPEQEIPANFYFCGGGSLLPDIQEIMMSYPWQSKLNIKKHPKFNYIFPNKISGVIDKTRMANNINDVAALSLAKFLGN